MSSNGPAPSVADSRRRPRPSDSRAEVGIGWLIQLRWGAAFAQLATVVAAREVLGMRLPLARVLPPIAIEALSNAVLALALRGGLTLSRRLCGFVLILDTLLLTVLLHATGGATNPFSILYLVHITLAAVFLGSRWTWSLAVLSIACYGLLFYTYVPLGYAAHAHTASDFSGHLQGMWVAFAVAAALTAYFVVKLSSAIEKRDAEIAAVREVAARNERVASLTTLAAGAAHELGTPLATIAVAAKELERALQALPEPYRGPLAEDARLIRSELDRCRAILDRMAADAGEAPGEAPVPMRIADLVSDIMNSVPPADRPRLCVLPAPEDRSVRVPKKAFMQVAQSLLSNALEAGAGPVRLGLASDEHSVRLSVQDEGPGMPPEVLSRAGEPFFSTKPPGRGLGLGLFLARTLSEQMGGQLVLESAVGRGTTAMVAIPRESTGSVGADR